LIALITLSIFDANAFAVIRSPYPRKTTAPDTVVVITDDRQDSVRPNYSNLKVNNNYGHGRSGFTLSSVADVF
jgi:hypothetical protein